MVWFHRPLQLGNPTGYEISFHYSAFSNMTLEHLKKALSLLDIEAVFHFCHLNRIWPSWM